MFLFLITLFSVVLVLFSVEQKHLLRSKASSDVNSLTLGVRSPVVWFGSDCLLFLHCSHFFLFTTPAYLYRGGTQSTLWPPRGDS